MNQANAVEAIPDQIIVKYKAPTGFKSEGTLTPENVSPGGKRTLLPGSMALESTSFESRDDTVLVKVAQGTTAQAAARFAAQADVEWAIPNSRMDLPNPGMIGTQGSGLLSQIRSNDPMVSRQWYLDRIHAPEAWAMSTGIGVTVAVLDTGVDYTHPDLAGAVDKGHDFVSGGGDPKDVYGHGTHVAGIIGARKDNGVGIVGVAPGCRILAIKVLGVGGGSGLFSVARGIKAAADHGKKTGQKVVINLSLGSSLPVDPINYMMGWYAARQGALLVAAAGNDNGPIGTPAKIKYYLAVAATDPKDGKATFSNFGPQLAISAPGVDIFATTPTYEVPMNKHGIAKDYAPLQGTSMATPVVSGVAALIWSKHPEWKADQVKDALIRSARAIGDKATFGAGLVDARAALAF